MLLGGWFLVVPYCARVKGYDHHSASSMELWKQGLGVAQAAWTCVTIAGVA
jgi:hypothetical protein